MNLTWRQLNAYLELNDTLDRIEQAIDLGVAAMGARGDGTEVEKMIKELGAS